MYPITRSPFLDLTIWLKPRGLNKVFEAVTPSEVKIYNNFVKDSVSERIQLHQAQREKPRAEQRHDMFHFLCEAKNPETDEPAYNETELRAEANLLIVAGSDTTSIALCGIFFYLTRNHHPYAKLVQEIRRTFRTAEDIVSGPSLMSCLYLRAYIDEGMRLTPAGPSELGREVRPGGLVVQGEYIPAGVLVGTAGWATSRNEEVHGDAYTFRPERWIASEETGVTEEDVAGARTNFHLFSQGPGNCVGKNLAMQDLLVTVARTLYRLNVRKPPESSLGEGTPELGWGRRDRRQYQLRDAYISVREGPEIQFRKRVD